MKTKPLISALMILLLSGACMVALVDPRYQGRAWPGGTFRKDLDLKPGAAISLENADGNIEISGWKEEKLEVYAERGGELPKSAGIYFYGQRFSPPDVRVRSAGDSVRISTLEKGHDEQGGVVHYVLRTPHSVNLDSIRNGKGRIAVSDIYGQALLDADEGEVRISNYSGSLDVRLGSGLVEAEVLDLRPQDSVRIKVERGDIVLFLEPDAAAQLIADAPGGSVLSELEVGQPLPAKRVAAKLGAGGGSIELTAVAGDIRIRKVEETP